MASSRRRRRTGSRTGPERPRARRGPRAVDVRRGGVGRRAPPRRGARHGASAILIVVKLALAVTTGSLAILAEAAHSAATLVAALVAALGGRGGSSTAGALEGTLVIAAAGVIGFASLRGLGGEVDMLGAGLVGLALSSVVAGLAARYVGRVARESASRELQADAAHLRTTSMTSAVVTGTLGIVALTGLDALDGLTALGIAFVVGRSGLDLVRAVRPGNEGLDAAEIAVVARVLSAGPPTVIGYRRLRAAAPAASAASTST